MHNYNYVNTLWFGTVSFDSCSRFIVCLYCVCIMYTSKEPVCPRVELILKIIIILLIIFLGFIKSKPC